MVGSAVVLCRACRSKPRDQNVRSGFGSGCLFFEPRAPRGVENLGRRRGVKTRSKNNKQPLPQSVCRPWSWPTCRPHKHITECWRFLEKSGGEVGVFEIFLSGFCKNHTLRFRCRAPVGILVQILVVEFFYFSKRKILAGGKTQPFQMIPIFGPRHDEKPTKKIFKKTNIFLTRERRTAKATAV